MDGPAHCDEKLDGSGLAGSWGPGFRGKIAWPFILAMLSGREEFISFSVLDACGFFFFFLLAFESKVLGCSLGRAETPLGEVSSEPSLSQGWSLSAWG